MVKKRVRLLISGKVQGVFFRQSMKDVADKNNVKGWVKNRPEGRVEAVLEGDADSVSKLVQWSHEGPDSADVVNVDIHDEEFAEEFTDFDIIA